MAARIKGASIINTLSILREVLGSSRFQKIVDGCPAKTQQLIRRTLVAVEWIPMEVWSPFIQAIYEQICQKDELQFRRLVRAVCKRDFSTIYRAHLQGASQQTILKKSADIWSSYFDTGSLTMEPGDAASPDAALTVRLRDLETSYPLYAVTMQAYLEQLLLMTGAARSTVRRVHEQLSDGKLSCDYVVTLEA
jgi:hypothetical protein